MREAQPPFKPALKYLQEQVVLRLWIPLIGLRTNLSTKDGNYGQKRLDSPKKRGRRANLVQAPPQSEQDTHINENEVRQPNPPVVNMLKIVNHIGASKGPQEKHLKFQINVDPRGP